MKNWLKNLFSPAEQPAREAILPRQSDREAKERGDVLMRAGDFATAAQCYREAIDANPGFAKAHANLGFVLKELGQLEEARQAALRAIELNHAIADAHYLLGTLSRSNNQNDDANAYFRAALHQDPGNEFMRLEYSKFLFEQGKPEDATQVLDEGLKLDPESVSMLFYLGNIHHERNAFEQAISCFNRALSIDPDQAQVLANLGIAFLKLENLDAAILALEKAIRLNPHDADSCNNLGNAYLKKNFFKEAMTSYERGLKIDPQSERLRYNSGLLSLLLGDFESGWRNYECRWSQIQEGPRHHFAQPLWLNDFPISGKTILLHAEQGMGDTLQFVRYVERVVVTGAVVCLEVHAPLKSLMAQIPGVAKLLSIGDPLPAFDCHCPLASLPLAFDTRTDTIPTKLPYLHAPAARKDYWTARLAGNPSPRIGLVWAGGTFFKNDHHRSIALQRFARIAAVGDLRCFSLQRDLRAGDDAALAAMPNITHLGPELSDFSETAAAIANLDLIISVDTAVAHLAGAMGKAVWILLPFSPDFRWQLNRQDSPWYPSARLFRQTAIGDWDQVLDDVAAELTKEFGKKLPG